MSGLTFGDDLMRISKTTEGLQKQIGKALEYTIKKKWRVTSERQKMRRNGT